MNKRKLIGAIIGVIAFIALVAGATYAWLTSDLAVNNGAYNVKTMNFLVSYTKGNNINNIVSVTSPTASNTKVLTVKAGLATDSAPGTITIYLNTTSASNAIITGGYLKYSWCIGTCSGTAFSDHTATVSSTGQIALISGETLTTTKKNFNIYFWLDGNKNESTIEGLSYAGNISAIATQTE